MMIFKSNNEVKKLNIKNEERKKNKKKIKYQVQIYSCITNPLYIHYILITQANEELSQH